MANRKKQSKPRAKKSRQRPSEKIKPGVTQSVVKPFMLAGIRAERESNSDSARWKHVKMHVKESFRPGATRDIKETAEVKVNDDDLIEIEFERGVRVWINGADYREHIGSTQRALDSSGAMTIPSSLQMGDRRTRGVVSWLVKSLNVIGVDLTGKAAVEIGKFAEKPGSKNKPWLGLSRCTLNVGNFKLEKLTRQPSQAQSPFLLFIHGTLSSTRGSFGELWNHEEILSELQSLYGERVLGFDHRTLTESPIQNAIELIRGLNSVLPDKADVHLVTHSRGGLVGELLCWSGNESLPADPLSEDKRSDEQLRKSFRSLQTELKKKKFNVTRFVRVACPASGTTLASGRLDRWLSVVGSVLGSAPPKTPLGDLFADIGEFIAAVIKERTDPESLPGIEAMMPESGFIKAINQAALNVSGDLAVIAGDIEPDKWWVLPLVWATDKFYDGRHDLVVNTDSMYGGAARSGRALLSYHEGPGVNHFSYFKNADSAVRVIEALTLPADKSNGFDVLERNTKPIAREVKAAEVLPPYAQSTYKPPKTIKGEVPVAVTVAHGDLAFASHPVVVGHYEGDTIISAERYLDGELAGALSHRHELGLYPGPLGTSAVFLNPQFTGSAYVVLKGAIVVGLGQVGRLSAASLSRTVARAMQEYALQWSEASLDRGRDEKEKELDVTSLLIGTGAGGISVADAVRAVLLGVASANRSLRATKAKLGRRIRSVEFIELWEDRAIEAVKELARLTNDPDFAQFTFLPLEKRKGGMQRLSTRESPGWWQRLQILGRGLDSSRGGTGESGNVPLRFSSLTKRARVEVTLHQAQRTLVDDFIRQSITTTRDNDRIALTLFELLLPNELKDQAPDQDNLVLILDNDAASYPWELLRDPDDKRGIPNSVQKGLLRQLETVNAPPKVRESGGFNALIVGDPKSRFIPLPSAREEARAVWKLLNTEYFDAGESLIQRSATEIINALYAKPYRVLHLAGHGVYDFALPQIAPRTHANGGAGEQRRTGMILSDDIVLSPTEVRQMRNVPELVFINCCHLGRIEQTSPRTEVNARSDYNKIAANVATEFIQSGVRAVVAAGWAVDDDAALTFAETFYQAMLGGETFGDAVLRARQKVYRTHPGSNTWGAYQCYGDPDYRFRKMERKKSIQRAPDFISPHEAAVEIENVAAGLAFADRDAAESSKQKLEKIEIELEKKGWLRNGRILAALGWAYGEAEAFDKAIAFYARAEKSDDGAIRHRDLREWANLEVRSAAKRVEHTSASLDEFERVAQRALDRLTKLPAAPEVLRLQGSVHKRRAMVNAANRVEVLREMTDKYNEAHHLKIGKKADAIEGYSFLNWKSGEIALALQTGSLNDERKKQLHGELRRAEEHIRTTSKNKRDFWDAVMRVDLHLLLAMTERDIAAPTVARLIAEYKEAKKLSSAREFASVLDQLDFLLTMVKDKDNDMHKALKELKKRIS